MTGMTPVAVMSVVIGPRPRPRARMMVVSHLKPILPETVSSLGQMVCTFYNDSRTDLSFPVFRAP